MTCSLRRIVRAAGVALLAAAACPTSAQTHSCAVPDLRTGGARTSFPPGVETVGVSTSEGWRPVFKGDGASRLRGSARNAVLRHGVLWLVDPSAVGLSETQAISALLKGGAAVARREGDGRVYFRARRGEEVDVATRALGFSGARERRAVSVRPTGGSLGVDVAIIRVEGRYSGDSIGFVDTLPMGMMVYPFGTGFVVHVPSARASEFWRAVDSEGGRTFLVGASATPVVGSQMTSAVSMCGGAALLSRFPSPVVSGADGTGMTLRVEGQSFGVRHADVVAVVQQPPYGRGVELAIARVAAR